MSLARIPVQAQAPGSVLILLMPRQSLILSAVGGAILAYLAALKIGGAGIGDRPLLLLGVLLVVVGIQLLSLGLVGEMLTSQNEARTSAGERLRFYVRDTLD